MTTTRTLRLVEPTEDSTDDRTMEEFCRRHTNGLRKYILSLTFGDVHLADDVLQETFLRAWRQPEVVADARDSRRAWLHTVAKHIVIDRSRWRGRRPQEAGDAALPWIAEPTCHIDRMVTSLALRQAVNKLPRMQREILVELYYRERSLSEIADKLGIPVGTVKSRAHYALRALRAEMNEPAALAA
jgi:RNA polymerase sigma-70 factor, ECF subfamily